MLAGLVALAHAARARLQCAGDRDHRLGRQDLHQGGAAAGVRTRKDATHASTASFNNHWGVPLSLARCPASVRFAIFEIGMNHAGEIETLVKMVRPQVAVDHHRWSRCIWNSLPASRRLPTPRRKFLTDSSPAARWCSTATIRNSPDCSKAPASSASPASSHSVPTNSPTRVCSRCRCTPTRSAVHANILGHDVTYKLGMPGRHMAMNSLAVLAAASLAGADLALAALSLSQIEPAAGRGARRALEVASGEATLIDESYNANPASMAAALNVLGGAAIGPQGRRIAVLGDMLELGPDRRGAASRAESMPSRPTTSISYIVVAR